MKEKFERFKNEKTVINVRSKKQYDEFMKMCEKQGLKWCGRVLPTKDNVYNDYEEKTCINLNNLMWLTYSDINYFKNYGYEIITYEDFMKEESKQFTKTNLKDNHIVVLRNNTKILYTKDTEDGFKKLIKQDLTHSYGAYLDIMEVWEFETLIWQREEKPVEILDDKEKEWLNHFIKSTKIKVKYIQKWLGASCENEYLEIVYDVFNHEYNEDRQGSLYLPIFKKGTMYKNMELNKKYTLAELGLED